MYEIIYHDRIKEVLGQEFLNVRSNLQIISAYCTKSALEYVDSMLLVAPITKRLMVRFRLCDILSRATDFSIYEYCKEKGWELYIQFDLHAKTFVFDKKRWIVGSANLTSKGIGLVENSNLEMAILADVEESELVKINSMFEMSTKMTDNLYELMRFQVEGTNTNPLVSRDWSREIIDLVKSEIYTLFTQDFPKSKSPFEIIPADFLLLLLPNGTKDIPSIRDAFVRTPGYKWLIQTLKYAENHQLYFGAITVLLHDALVNDPRPYRKDVKDLLANMLTWIVDLNIDNITVERPNHSQLITLVE